MIDVIADISASFFSALLSGMGIGNGGIFIVYLTLISGITQLTAQGINLIFFISSSSASLIYHIKKKSVIWGAVLLAVPSGIIGSLLGSILATLLPVGIIRLCFGILLCVSGVITLFSGKK